MNHQIFTTPNSFVPNSIIPIKVFTAKTIVTANPLRNGPRIYETATELSLPFNLAGLLWEISMLKGKY
jgi:hypothetical protein